MSKLGFLTKDVSGSFADIDTAKGIVVSYPSTFDVVDSGHERVRKGAFARTIKSWGPEGKMRTKALFDHKPYHLIGRPLELAEDGKGLRAVTQISKTSLGKDILTLINDKVITEQSIGYDLVRQEKAKDGVLDILEVKLYEYSFLAWGMNEDTPIVELKGFDPLAESSVIEQMRRMEKALRDGTFETDEVPYMLEIALKQWAEAFPRGNDERENPRIKVGDGDVHVEDEPEVIKAAKDFEESLVEISEARDMWRKFDDISAAHNKAIYDTLFYESEDEPEKRLRVLKRSLRQYGAAVEVWAAKFLGLEDLGEAKGIRTVVDFEDEGDSGIKAVKDDILFLQSLAQGDSGGNPTHTDSDSMVKSEDSGEVAHSEDYSELIKALSDFNTKSEGKSVEVEMRKFFEELGL